MSNSLIDKQAADMTAAVMPAAVMMIFENPSKLIKELGEEFQIYLLFTIIIIIVIMYLIFIM